MADTRIEGRVAEILNSRELVVNRGSEHNVYKGMRFVVLSRQGATIVDPETGQQVGAELVPKAVVEIVRVRPQFSVARTFRKQSNRRLTDIFGALPEASTLEELNTDEPVFEANIDTNDLYVRRGDVVIQVSDDEYLVD
jgi:hypothetical protein